MTYGGGYSALPLVDDLIVRQTGWITEDVIADIISISEMTPGPFCLNCASFVGTQIAGVPGAISATFGFLLPSLIIILILAYYYNKYNELTVVKQVFAVLNACIIGILIASSINLLRSSVFMGKILNDNIDIKALFIFIVSFIAMFKFKCNPVIAILLSALTGMIVYPIF